jgi:ATP-dependent DNA helicase RecQ
VTITPDDEDMLRRILNRVADDQPRQAWFDEGEATHRYQVDRLVDWLVRHDYLRLDDPLDERYSVTEKAGRFLDRNRE